MYAVPDRPQPPRWRQWALAASVVLASLAAVTLWLLRPSDTLASEVVAHVQGEPQSWLATHTVSAGAIDHALTGSGIGLDVDSDKIVYAQSCWFRGHYVPHLVLQTAHGPATVLHPAARARQGARRLSRVGHERRHRSGR